MRSVRWRYPLISAALAAALAVPLIVLLVRDASSADRFRGSEPPEPIAAPSFSLRSYTGETVGMRDLRGKAVAVTFLDTQCKEACPVIAGQIAKGLDRLGRSERTAVAALAITVDPDEDTPANVRAFLREHRAVGKLEYLIGPNAELERVWDEFQVLPSARSGDDDIHSAPVRIYDVRGRWVATLHPGVDLTPENLAHDLRLVLEDGR